ncbi:hypothetical protein [Nitrosomonas sp.]|uniref:hypothetical protein n=1 Tax=Nitrosomonas sp. TaxID=42353 RepID=UPI001D924AD8|nr:hypothetical protein [Nitrosomonas sp.]MBX3617476.1 hypothetical protein [Nitrosomonas sp.]
MGVVSDLDPYHAVAYRLWLRGSDLSMLYPSRKFKSHCRAIKAVLGVDVSTPRIIRIEDDLLIHLERLGG